MAGEQQQQQQDLAAAAAAVAAGVVVVKAAAGVVEPGFSGGDEKAEMQNSNPAQPETSRP